jgi:hypothetical protein
MKAPRLWINAPDPVSGTAELRQISKRADARAHLHMPPVATYVLYAGAVACIFGGSGFTILSVIKSKQKSPHGMVSYGGRVGIDQRQVKSWRQLN